MEGRGKQQKRTVATSGLGVVTDKRDTVNKEHNNFAGKDGSLSHFRCRGVSGYQYAQVPAGTQERGDWGPEDALVKPRAQ